MEDKKEVVDETKKVDETEEKSEAPIKEKETEKVDETKEKETETEKSADEQPAQQVSEVEPVGNGLRIEDIVTKDMLAERLSALEAKFDAVVKENADLKNELSARNDELNGMKDKYENKDFGNVYKQGVPTKDKYANDSFEEYSKQFM